MKKSWEQIHQELSEPFSHEDVEWKIQTVSKDKSRGLAVAYVTARAIQNRLDAVVGAQNWKPVFRQWHTVTDRDGNPIPSQLCTIQIFDDERHEWLEKTDGAENTDYEPVKGGLSDAMKRAASQWGIGRYLLQSQLNDVNARISAVVDYASVRNELLFKALHTPNVEFQLYDVVKKTGELVPAWKLRYRGTIYQCLSRSEKILAGLEVVELLKRLTGRCYPVFIDDSESVDHIPRPSGQALISKKVADQPLKVQVKNTSMNLPKAG